jgi:hypothetical protein
VDLWNVRGHGEVRLSIWQFLGDRHDFLRNFLPVIVNVLIFGPFLLEIALNFGLPCFFRAEIEKCPAF